MEDWLDDLLKERDALDAELKHAGVAGYLSVGLGPVGGCGTNIEIGLVVFLNPIAETKRIPREFHGIPIKKIVVSDRDEAPKK